MTERGRKAVRKTGIGRLSNARKQLLSGSFSILAALRTYYLSPSKIEVWVDSDDEIQAKSDVLRAGRPLRLIPMKGALELPRVAAELHRRKVPFTMDIYGKGDLEEALAAQIASLELSDHVTLHGPLDFEGG